ncbi:MAG: RNA polymerase subunit sigma-70, partial [Selenomonadaceae bacterium]|nr:RNA polymerase subunit sigma-70 [Selenomonadaceae bacterium]
MQMEEYLRELSHVKLLEPEEEQGLWLRYRQQKDEEARRLIIESYQPLVFRTALPYRTMENIMDVIQEG